MLLLNKRSAFCETSYDTFFKASYFFIGILVLALCIFLVPKIGDFAGELYPNIAYMKPLILIDMYAAAIPFYFALYQACE